MRKPIPGFFIVTFLIVGVFATTAISSTEYFCPGGTIPDDNVIWCDDFEDSTVLSEKYFDYDSSNGTFLPVSGTGMNGSRGLENKWQTGQVSAGHFFITFGRSPVNSKVFPNNTYTEIYWRFHMKNEIGWTGNPYKVTRATIFATSNWAQAMIAHLWGDGSGDALMIDPASGVDGNGNLVTTTWNDFSHLQWLGLVRGTTPVFSSMNSGKWQCIEVYVKLNNPGASDGIFEFWIDGKSEARRTDLNWVKTWQAFGINAISIESYWNPGAPGSRTRWFDNFVVSTKPIGCGTSSHPSHEPNPPIHFRIIP